jgi:acetolactate synthase-1/2/3 large subunit
MPSGADLFVDAAQKLGIDTIFTLVGDHLNDVLSVAGRRGLRILDMRHESGVTHAADAWGRIHRRPGLAMVTGGPGHTNSLTGIATCYQAASPMIAVSGAPSSALAGRQVFQVIDQVGMAAPVVKYAAQPTSPAQLPYYLGRAYNEAVSGRMGPVHLTIPVDVFEAKTESPLPMPAPAPQPRMAPSASEVDMVLKLLHDAERPIVIGGSGLWWADAGQPLRKFLERTSLPFYSVTMARGMIRDDWRTAMGYADGALNKAVHQAFPEADVVLVLGKRIDYRLALGGPRLFSPGAKFLQVDCHAPELGCTRALEIGICADVAAALRSMLDALGKERSPRNGMSPSSPGIGAAASARGGKGSRGCWKPKSAWIRKQRQWRAEWQGKLAGLAADRSAPIHPAAFFADLAKSLPPNVLYAWDGGDFIHWGRAILPAHTPGGWLRLGPLGTIGSALPNSVALQLAHPNEPVVMITGDGSLGFYIAEFDTLVRHNLPVVIIVGNDAGWGLERELQAAMCGTTIACELRPTRYDLVMKGFGGEGENIESLDQVAPAVKRAFAAKRPYLLNVNIRGARSPFTEWQLGGKKK